MTVRQFVSLTVTIALVMFPLMAGAQQTAPGEAQLWRTLAGNLETAALVSVRLKDGSRIKGTLIGTDDEALTIKPQTRVPVPARAIRFDDVASIERERRSVSPAKKVLLGVGIGTAVYMLIVAAILSGAD